MARIIDTAYGEVMVKPNEDTNILLECYNGDNFDEYIGEIEGSIYDNDEIMRAAIENSLF